MRVRLPNTVAAGLALVLASASLATDRYCPDCVATSPNGQYKFESTHPNNRLARPEPFVCQGFTFTLTDLQSGKTLWQRQQRESEFAPLWAGVSDSGWVVGGGDMQHEALEPTNGQAALTWDVEKLFTPDDLKHVLTSQTTAGRIVQWADCARASFIAREGKTYFVTRTWWDRRIWVDLSDSKVDIAADAALTQIADESDKAWVLRKLDGAADRLAKLTDKDPKARQERLIAHSTVIAAVHLAGRMKLKQTIPVLHSLESSEYSGLRAGGRGNAGDDGIDPLSRTERTLRQHVHLALRRLGEKPGSRPCNTFSRMKPDGTREELPSGPLIGLLELSIDKIANGLGVVAVLDTIGAPDVVYEATPITGPARWEYDVDTGIPFTLVISWNNNGTVSEVDRRQPAAWQNGWARDQSLFDR